MSTKRKPMTQMEMLQAIQKQLNEFDSRISALEAVSHEQPDLEEMMQNAYDIMHAAKTKQPKVPKKTPLSERRLC